MDVDLRDRTDPDLISASEEDLALPEEIAALHNWPDDWPDTDPVTVAVMDSGIHPDAVAQHPWFEGTEVIGNYDASGGSGRGDKVGHGTGVASLISRMAPNVELLDVRIFGSETRTGFSVIRRAYEWLIKNAGDIDIVNMSWGARRNVMQINQLHERLVQAGVNDVVAAGNTGTDGGSPATSGLAFSAGALTEEGAPARFSSFDPDQGNPDIATVGVNVKMARAPGTKMGGVVDADFVKGSGTSFAAPLASAAYATALAAERSDWDQRLIDGADDIDGTPRDGAGILKLPGDLFVGPPEEEEPPDSEEPPGDEEEPPDSDGPPPDDEPPREEPGTEDENPSPPTLEEATFNTYLARAEDVIDGDTVDLIVDLGFMAEQHVRMQVVGVDTAEIFFVEDGSEEREEGLKHKAFTEDYLFGEDGEPSPLYFEVIEPAADYGQWIGDVRRVGADKTLSEALIDEFPSVEIDDGDADKGGEESAQEEDPAPEAVDLEAITGVGPARSESLREAGYQSASDVASASAEELAEAIGLSQKQAQTIIDNAADA